MAKIKVTKGNGEKVLDRETNLIVAISDAGDNGTNVTVLIEGASTIDVAAAISSLKDTLEKMKERHPDAALLVEFRDQMKELEEEENKD